MTVEFDELCGVLFKFCLVLLNNSFDLLLSLSIESNRCFKRRKIDSIPPHFMCGSKKKKRSPRWVGV